MLFYVHGNRRLIRDGEPRTATSTFTQLLNSAEVGKDGDYMFVATLTPALRWSAMRAI